MHLEIKMPHKNFKYIFTYFTMHLPSILCTILQDKILNLNDDLRLFESCAGRIIEAQVIGWVSFVKNYANS